jgi:hypothetical protein
MSLLFVHLASGQGRSRGGESRGTVSPPSLMTVPPTEAALHVFNENAFLVRATGTFEGPAIESRVTRLNPRKVHLRGAFWAPRAIVHIRACRRIFELWHVRLQTGCRRELLPDPQPPTPSEGSRPTVSNSHQRERSRLLSPSPNALAVGAGFAPAPTAYPPATIKNDLTCQRGFSRPNLPQEENAAPSRAGAG